MVKLFGRQRCLGCGGEKMDGDLECGISGLFLDHKYSSSNELAFGFSHLLQFSPMANPAVILFGNIHSGSQTSDESPVVITGFLPV